ncbi:unnamed protein product [Mucor hiemalis]
MPSRTPPMRGLMDLARAYANLPQHLMICCLEHPDLPVQDAIQRSYFAKRVLSIVSSMNSHRQGQLPHHQQQYKVNNNLMAVLKFENGVDTIAVVKQTGLKKGCWDPKLYDLHY